MSGTIYLVQHGDFSKTEKYFQKLLSIFQKSKFDKYGQQGVEALRKYTPKRSGITANSWTYSVDISEDRVVIAWDNTNVNKNVKIALLIQYGHGTGTGGYVQGQDYINPAMKPIFENILEGVRREVVNSG